MIRYNKMIRYKEMIKYNKMTGGLWYDRVYLCWEDTNLNKSITYNPVKGFNCYKYKSVEAANTVWENTLYEYSDMKVRHTVIPLCKWIPEIFDKYLINRKLRKIYWLEKNTFGIGHNQWK